MFTNARRWTWGIGIAAGLVFGSAVMAKPLPKLPPDYTFPQAERSPGKVTFKHTSHVDEASPDCTACHPGQFKILKKGTPAQGLKLNHKTFEKGKLCGSCHDEKKAFGLSECDTCHTIE